MKQRSTILSSILVPLCILLLFDGIEETDAIDCGRCVCSTDPATGYQNVDCFGIPFAEIKLAFGANTGLGDINRFRVLPKVGDSLIPANLLGSNQARIFNLTSCGDNVMEIDPNAFKSSSATTLEFFIIDCNVINLTWTFLNGFTNINLLQLEVANNIQSLGTLPSLPSVKRLSIIDCTGFDSLKFPGSSLRGLQNLILTENVELTEGKVESILAALSATNVLEMLSLKSNPFIRRIPDTLANFSALNTLDLSFCNIDSITSGFLSFTAPVKILDLSKMYLSNISDFSFDIGYYGNAKVSLDGNQLTEFRPTVYKKILTEMQTSLLGTPGIVSIRKNPITCDCQMAWIIRDSRDLLPFVSGTCSNSTEFQDLNPNWYEQCDPLTTSTTPQPTTTITTTISTTNRPMTTSTTPQPTTTITTTISTTTRPMTTSTTTTTTMNPTTFQETTTSQSTTTLKVTTTEIPTTSTLVVTTQTTGSSPPPSDNNYDTFFYILYGILGLVALILIAGLIYWACINAAKKRKLAAMTRNLEVSSRSSSSVSRRTDLLSSISTDQHRPLEPRQLDRRALDPHFSYVRMPEPHPPPVNNFGGSVRITTPYRQQPTKKNQSGPPPTNRVRGLRRVEF